MNAPQQRTMQGVVLSCIAKKSRSRKGISVTMKVQSNQTGRPVTVRMSIPDAPLDSTRQVPPLPGTEIRVRGALQEFGNSSFLQCSGEQDLKMISGHQGALMRDVTAEILTNLGIKFDPVELDNTFISPDLHLPQMTEELFFSLLNDKLKIPNAKSLFENNDAVFADALTQGMLEGLMRISSPHQPDARFERIFKSGVWPKDAMEGTITKTEGGMDFIKTVDGKSQHPCMRKGSRLRLHESLSHDGIDNFFRALSIGVEDPRIYSYWINDARRDSMVTQAFIKDKHQDGTQMFTTEILTPLDKSFGINAPDQIAARLGSMFKVGVGQGTEEVVLIPMGTYQSASQIGMLSKFQRGKIPLGSTKEDPEGKNLKVDRGNLDIYQAAALDNFVAGTPVCLIAGPPGTGKSHIVSRLYETAQAAGEDIIVITPTGKAAARLNQSFAKEHKGKKGPCPVAVTMHAMFYDKTILPTRTRSSFLTNAVKRALDSSSHEMFPTRPDYALLWTTLTDKSSQKSVDKPRGEIYAEMSPPPILAGRIVFCDESSMLTNDHMGLVMACNPKQLVLIGDPSQLPAVGSGKPFADLIRLAREGYMEDKMSLAELKIDHRATKELAACTKVVRGDYDDNGVMIEGGKLPEDKVIVVGDGTDLKALAKSVVQNEFTIVQVDDTLVAKEILNDVYVEELEKNAPFYRFHYGAAIHDKDSVNMVMPFKMATELSAHRATMPDIMMMAPTNKEVNDISTQVKSLFRSHNEVGGLAQMVFQMAPMVSNNLLPGDLIMQTKNNKVKIDYATPQGKRTHMPTVNGESFLWVGSNIWLPLPSAAAGTDIQNRINNQWIKTGLFEEIMTDVAYGKTSDPDYHVEVYQKLVSMVEDEKTSQVKMKAADALSRMALTEVFSIDTSKLVDLNLKKGDVFKVSEDLLNTMVILPRLSSDRGMQKQDEGMVGLATQNFGIKIPKSVRASERDMTEKDRFNEMASGTIANIANYTIGDCYTVHKAQGSQGGMSICMVSEPSTPERANHHEQSTYTAITRAKNNAVVMIVGSTVEKINEMWKEVREKNAALSSANYAVASGAIPPLAESLQMMTTSLPENRGEITSAYMGRLKTAHLYRQRTLLTSMGVPSDMKWDDMPYSQRPRVAFSTPNRVSDKDIMPTNIAYPDSGNISQIKAEPSVMVAKSSRMTWEPGMISKITNDKNITDEMEIQKIDERAKEEVADFIGDMAIDFDNL